MRYMLNMSTLLGLVIIFISYVSTPFFVDCNEDKRILLNDPATIQSLLHQYETQLNKYGITLQHVESKVAQLEIDNAKLKKENENLNSSLASLRMENNNMNSSLVNLRVENKKMNNQITNLLSNNQSVTYIRWGRTTCRSDSNTELLYKGVTGGSFFADKGSGVNALCLPHNPDNGVSKNSLTSELNRQGSLYGAEYQYNYKNVRIDDDVPCAVCLVKQASSVLMMPAKSSCPTGWQIQYNGILTTEYDGQKPSQYTCMDGDPEFIEGTRKNNDDGKLFFPVKTVCGSLPCPPYVSGALVECAVCSK